MHYTVCLQTAILIKCDKADQLSAKSMIISHRRKLTQYTGIILDRPKYYQHTIKEL